MADIHNRKAKLQATIQKLKDNPELSDHNTDLVLQFKNTLESQNLSVDRVSRYLSSFNTLAKAITFNLDEADKTQLQGLVADINQDNVNEKEYTEWTKSEFRKVISKFYKWHTGEDNPDIIKWLTTSPKSKNLTRTDPRDLPDTKDLKALVNAADHKRDEALVFLLYDSCARIGEALNITWGDIAWNDELTEIKIRESKTGERTIYVRECIETLREWRDAHPESSNPDQYVFIKLRKQDGEHVQMTYSSAYSALQRLKKKAGVETDCNPHAFRKAGLTRKAAQGMNEAQLCEFAGWKQGSEMASTYIRMAKSDLQKSMKRLYGLDNGEEEKTDNLEPVKCGECGEKQPRTNDYCRECDAIIAETGKLLDERKQQQVESNVKNELMVKAMQGEIDPDNLQGEIAEAVSEQLGKQDYFEG